MRIKCSCGETVVEGDIKYADKRGGGQKRVFIAKLNKVIGHKEFPWYGQTLKVTVTEPIPMNGEIHKNNSNDPKKWTGLCSSCQKKSLKGGKR